MERRSFLRALLFARHPRFVAAAALVEHARWHRFFRDAFLGCDLSKIKVGCISAKAFN